MSDTHNPEEMPRLKKTLAGNFRIPHPEFENAIFPRREDASWAWSQFLTGKWKSPLKSEEL